MLPLASGAVEFDPAMRVLFLRARAGRALDTVRHMDLTCVQSFAPDRDALERSGFKVAAEASDGQFGTVLVLPARQRQEARAQLAEAVSSAVEGGLVVACAPNTEGARTVEKDLSDLLGDVDNVNKNKCRAVWGQVRQDAVARRLLEGWLELDRPREVLDGAYRSRPGLFAWDRIDPASRLLAGLVPETLKGRGADLGAGFGYLARTVLEKAPKVTSMDLYEAERRALVLAEENLTGFRGRKVMNGVWCDVTKGIEGPYDFIVSYPPIHQTGKADRTDVGQGFITAAAAGLRPGGEFYMVANRHLPYEKTLSAAFAYVAHLSDEGGYKVIRAVKAKGGR